MLDMNPQETYTAPEEVNTPSRPIDENALLQRHQVMVKRVVNQLRSSCHFPLQYRRYAANWSYRAG